MGACEIARRLPDATPRIVRYRIERLCREGMITITAVANPRALGYSVVADVLIEVEIGKVPEVVDRLAELEHVTYVSAATGDRDVSIQCVAKSMDELQWYVLNVLQKIPGIRRTQTYVLPSATKLIYNWKVPKEVYCSEQENQSTEAK